MPSLSHARIEGDRRVRQLISEMADRSSGIPKNVWAQVGDVVADNMAQQFATEGAHLNGGPWAPLSPPYLAWKVKAGYRSERLRRTDAMKMSLTSRPMGVETYSRMSARFGTSDEKAAFHQYGTKNMPQRQIINVTPDFADDVNSVLARYIFEDRLG